MAGDFPRGAQNAGADRGSDTDSDAKACTEHAQQVSRARGVLYCVSLLIQAHLGVLI